MQLIEDVFAILKLLSIQSFRLKFVIALDYILDL